MKKGQNYFLGNNLVTILWINPDNENKLLVKNIDKNSDAKDEVKKVFASELSLHAKKPKSTIAKEPIPGSCPTCGTQPPNYVMGIECPGCGFHETFKNWLNLF